MATPPPFLTKHCATFLSWAYAIQTYRKNCSQSLTRCHLKKPVKPPYLLETATKEVSQLPNTRSTAEKAIGARPRRQHAQAPRAHRQRDAPQSSQQRTSRRNDAPANKPCFRCAGDHQLDTCRWATATCRYCSKVGHVDRACITKARNMGTHPKVHLSAEKPSSQQPIQRKHPGDRRVYQITDNAKSDDEYIKAVSTKNSTKCWVAHK